LGGAGKGGGREEKRRKKREKKEKGGKRRKERREKQYNFGVHVESYWSTRINCIRKTTMVIRSSRRLSSAKRNKKSGGRSNIGGRSFGED
jgi:hypothetical protein